MHFVIINGPNLNLLGKREPSIYGNTSFEEHLRLIKSSFPEHKIDYHQSNHEGVIIDHLQQVGFTCDGIILNPAAYTHTSIALADTVKAIKAPVVEVHISDISKREKFRQISYVKASCVHSIIGMGLNGYNLAIEFLLNYYKD